MHQQARACVDLDDGCALRLHGFGNILCNQINASNVQAHNAGGKCRQLGHIGVNHIGDIDGHVAGAHDHHMAVFFRNALTCEALTFELKHSRGVIFEANGVEWEIFFFAAAWV